MTNQGGTAEAEDMTFVPIRDESLFYLEQIQKIFRRYKKMKKAPYRLYLSEEEIPKKWYNLRADMKELPDL